MKKYIDIAGKVITTIILIFSVCIMIFTIISVNTVGKDSGLFGYRPYIVLSDSMKDTFSVGDLTVSKTVDPQTLEPGDIITFKSIDPSNYGAVVTHKIREITQYNDEPAFITYGTTTNSDDSYPVPYSNVIGKYVFRLPKMGYFFEFLRSPAGYVTLILIPFLILIIIQALKFLKLVHQYRLEQQSELDMQKASIEAERQEALKIKEELEQLKAQLKNIDSEKSNDNVTVTRFTDSGGEA